MMENSKGINKTVGYRLVSVLIIAAVVLFGPLGLAIAAVFRKDWMKNKLILCAMCIWSLLYFVSFVSGMRDGFNDYGSENTTEDKNEQKEDESQQEKNEEPAKPDSVAQNSSVVCATNSVRNDKTGKWKINTVSKSEVVGDWAVDYYKQCFKNDDEIHAIVNFAYKTTTKFAIVGPWVNVTTYEYVDKEEHDAGKLFGGMVLTDKFYDAESGEEIIFE